MLKLSKSILNQQVISLRNSATVATIQAPVINPHNLKIEGFYCADSRNKQMLVLLTQDIRDIIPRGIVIDDYSVLTVPEDLVRLKDVLAMDYELVKKPVETVKKEKVGKVSDYAFEDQTYHVQKLYVERTLLKSFSNGQLSIDRDEIYEVTDKRVVIKELTKKAPSGVPSAAPAI